MSAASIISQLEAEKAHLHDLRAKGDGLQTRMDAIPEAERQGLEWMNLYCQFAEVVNQLYLAVCKSRKARGAVIDEKTRRYATMIEGLAKDADVFKAMGN